VEVDAFALDLRPLVDDGEDQEAEDEHGKADLEGEADPTTAGRARPELGSGLADPVQKWLAALHVRGTLVTAAALTGRAGPAGDEGAGLG
jgi:hypothetical protein